MIEHDTEFISINLIPLVTETVRSVRVLAGAVARLPCDLVQFPMGEDRAKLVMWFRNRAETPFYM